MKRTVSLLAGVLPILCGCGTIVPGPRYQRDAGECAFSHDGAAVFYVEDRFRLYPFILAGREGRSLWRYDRATRRHRLIAKTGAFSVSPYAALVLHAPEWKERFDARASTPDFLVLDLSAGETRGYSMPRGFDGGYLSYSFPHVAWDRGGGIDAFVWFYYEPHTRPSAWRRLGSASPNWRRELWEVRIDPARSDGTVVSAEPCTADKIPRVAWGGIRRRRAVSPDGTRELARTRFTGHYRFNTTLAVVHRGGGAPEYILKENPVLDYALAGKYILLSIASAPVFGVNSLLHGAQ